MVTVAELVRKLLEMPQDAPFALDGDCCNAGVLYVYMEDGTVCVQAYFRSQRDSNVTTQGE
jgi:hypothetical protein